MNEEINFDELSVEELEQLNIALGNQIQQLKDKRIQLNRVMEKKIAQQKAQAHIQQLNAGERQALLAELHTPQPITIGLKPGVVGAKGTQGV